MVDASNLRVKVTTNGGTSSDVSLHDVTDHFDRLAVLKAGRVYVCLANDCIPLNMVVSLDQKRTYILTA